MLHIEQHQLEYFENLKGRSRREILRARYLHMLSAAFFPDEIEDWFDTGYPSALKVPHVSDVEILLLLEIARHEAAKLQDSPSYQRCVSNQPWAMRKLWLKGQLELCDPDHPMPKEK